MGSAKLAVPTCTAHAPAIISSNGIDPTYTPPTPTIGSLGSAWATSHTVFTATGMDADAGQPAAHRAQHGFGGSRSSPRP